MIESYRPTSTEDAFNIWKNTYRELRGARFTASVRREAIEELCYMFIVGKYTIEDMKMYKRKALDFLVSETGKNRKGKHSNGKWIEDAENDFDEIVADRFLGSVFNNSRGEGYTPYREEIAKWVKDKFGTDNHDFVMEAHKINSQLLIDFVQDTFFNVEI